MWRCAVSIVAVCVLSLIVFVLLLMTHRGIIAGFETILPEQLSENVINTSSRAIIFLEIIFIITIVFYMNKRKYIWIGPNKNDRVYLLMFFLAGFSATFISLKYVFSIHEMISSHLYNNLYISIPVLDLILIHGLAFLALFSAIVMTRHFPDRS